MPFGVMGGYFSHGSRLLLGNLFDFGLDLQEAIDLPRLFATPDGPVEVEIGIPAEAVEGLKARGHEVVPTPKPIGGGQAIWIDHAEGVLTGGSEPRRTAALLVISAGAALKVAVGGLGTIGLPVARALDSGIHGLELAAVSARDRDKAARTWRTSRTRCRSSAWPNSRAKPISWSRAPAAVFAELAEAAVEAGRILVTVSCGALLDRMDLVEAGARNRRPDRHSDWRALGLDAVRAAAEGTNHSARIVTRKPPASLAGAPYLAEQGIDLDGLSEARKIFEGTAREGARGFPANVNVAAALSLAGVGPDETRARDLADPAQTRTAHKIVIEAERALRRCRSRSCPAKRTRAPAS